MQKVNNHHNLNNSVKLSSKIAEMVKKTNSGALNWEAICSTTEYNDSSAKPIVEENGKKYQVDECFVSYHTTWNGTEFVLISYEMIHSCQEDKNTTNMIFLPPLGIRFFDIHALLPYAVEADQILIYRVHSLWEAILDQKKAGNEKIDLTVESRELTIEED